MSWEEREREKFNIPCDSTGEAVTLVALLKGSENRRKIRSDFPKVKGQIAKTREITTRHLVQLLDTFALKEDPKWLIDDAPPIQSVTLQA